MSAILLRQQYITASHLRSPSVQVICSNKSDTDKQYSPMSHILWRRFLHPITLDTRSTMRYRAITLAVLKHAIWSRRLTWNYWQSDKLRRTVPPALFLLMIYDSLVLRSSPDTIKIHSSPVYIYIYIYNIILDGWPSNIDYIGRRKLYWTRRSRVQYSLSESNIIYIGRSTIQYLIYYSL